MNIIKQPMLPNTIRFHHTVNDDRVEVMRITRDGVWVNPDMSVDDAAQAVLRALDSQIKVLVGAAVAAEQTAQQEPVALPEKMYEFVPTPEPIKWHHPECEGQCIACLIEQVVQEAYGSQGLGYLQRHLTSPPASKPLTDEEIAKIAEKYTEPLLFRVKDFARAIEAKLKGKNT